MNRTHNILYSIGRPFSPFYALLMALRAFCYRKEIFKRHRLSVPVISVGNLSLGGTGKTPLVMYIAGFLMGLGKRPAVVSRGYGGKSDRQVNVVSDGKKILLDPSAAGDEPRLMAENLGGVPVLTGIKRHVVGQYAVTAFQSDCIVLDDGFQHLAVHRDVDLALFSAHSLLGNGRVFPGGELRESPAALARADAFVITGMDEMTEKDVMRFKLFLRERFSEKPIFFGEYKLVSLLHSQQKETYALDRAKRLPVYGFCGLANPESFRHTLDKEGFKVTGFTTFEDHYTYSPEDITILLDKARASKAKALITTEKDFVKLRMYSKEAPVFALKIELLMDEKFDFFLTERIVGSS